jgi:hypothetical protein
MKEGEKSVELWNELSTPKIEATSYSETYSNMASRHRRPHSSVHKRKNFKSYIANYHVPFLSFILNDKLTAHLQVIAGS